MIYADGDLLALSGGFWWLFNLKSPISKRNQRLLVTEKIETDARDSETCDSQVEISSRFKMSRKLWAAFKGKYKFACSFIEQLSSSGTVRSSSTH